MTFSEQFPIVLQALNVGFLQTLKLFAVTLIGAIPLGLVISFGSMSSWAPFGFLRPYVMKNGTPTERLTGWQRFQLWWVVDFKPIRLLTRSSPSATKLALASLPKARNPTSATRPTATGTTHPTC